jgi:chromosome partitioning protein
MFDVRLSIHKVYDRQIRETFGGDVFETRIPQAVAFKEAIAHRRPVSTFAPKSVAAESMRTFATELEARLVPAEVQS